MPKATPVKKAKAAVKAPPKAKKDFFPKIQQIIAGQLKKEPAQIKLNANLQADLDADSLDALEIIFQLEEEFKIKVAEEDATKMVSVKDIVAYVTAKAS